MSLPVLLFCYCRVTVVFVFLLLLFFFFFFIMIFSGWAGELHMVFMYIDCSKKLVLDETFHRELCSYRCRSTNLKSWACQNIEGIIFKEMLITLPSSLWTRFVTYISKLRLCFHFRQNINYYTRL